MQALPAWLSGVNTEIMGSRMFFQRPGEANPAPRSSRWGLVGPPAPPRRFSLHNVSYANYYSPNQGSFSAVRARRASLQTRRCARARRLGIAGPLARAQDVSGPSESGAGLEPDQARLRSAARWSGSGTCRRWS